MKIYTILLFSIATLLAVIGILICCDKLEKLKLNTFGAKKTAGAGLICTSVILTALGLVIIFHVKGTLFLLITGFFVVNSIFVLLGRENVDR